MKSSFFLNILLTREFKIKIDKIRNIIAIGISCFPIDWREIKPFLPPENPKLSINEKEEALKSNFEFSFFVYKVV